MRFCLPKVLTLDQLKIKQSESQSTQTFPLNLIMTVMHCCFPFNSLFTLKKTTHLLCHNNSYICHKHILWLFYTKHRFDDFPKDNQYREVYHYLKLTVFTNTTTNTFIPHLSPPKAVYRESHPIRYLQSIHHRKLRYWLIFRRIQVLTRWTENSKSWSNQIPCHLLTVLDLLEKNKRISACVKVFVITHCLEGREMRKVSLVSTLASWLELCVYSKWDKEGGLIVDLSDYWW